MEYLHLIYNKTYRITDIPIRLNGARPNKGVVEIYYEGSWNLVSSQPDPRIVAVLCRQLGFRYSI